jgi:NSS family neurotransmitter:Na+ symporter
MSHNQNTSSGWKKQSGFIWSLIGSAVGFGNILSFSATCYKNGGGAFLIPYFFALFILGIPLLILEGLIGHQWKEPIVVAYGKVNKTFGKTLGWIAVIACTTIGGFYIVLTGYTVAYTYFAATSSIPHDSATFFTKTFLQISASISDWGNFSYPIFFSTLAVALFTWFTLARNIKDGIEKICSFFMPLLASHMVIFAIVVCLLPGGFEGWIHYLKPDFSRLTEVALWRDVFGQLLFSLSLGLGIIVGYSRHTDQKINVVHAMKWMAIGDFSVSFLSGFVIFGFISHISQTEGIPFADILANASTFEIGFVIFPKLLHCLGPHLSPIIGAIFFFCLFIAGITGVFSIVESISGNIEREYSIDRRRAVTWATLTTMATALVFCMGNSSHIIDALVPMVIGSNMLFGSLALVITFYYCYPEISQHNTWMQNRFFARSLATAVPIILTIILIGNLYEEWSNCNTGTIVRWSWFTAALGIAFTASKRRSQRAAYAFHNR